MARILVADDEWDVRDLVAFTLRFNGHEVFEASNGEKAIKIGLKVVPDLFLLDVRMSPMSGYEACKQLKSMPELKDIPVVFLTARGQETEIQQGYDAGADEYLLKPFAPDQLAPRIKTILAMYGK